MQEALKDFFDTLNSTTVRSTNSRRGVSKQLRLARSAVHALSLASPGLAASFAERVFRTPRRLPRPAHEFEALAKARRFLVPFGDRTLAAWEWGDTGPRVLLVHGWEGRGAQLHPVAEVLIDRGFRVVTFDAPSHGDTSGTQTTFFEFASAIEAMVDAIGTPHAIVAHSMGGASTAWAARHRALARRYVMIAPPCDLRDFTQGFARLFALDEDVRQRMEMRIQERVGFTFDEARIDRVVSEQRTPLLVIHDLDDREVPFEKGRIVAEAWPGATLIKTDGLGHRRILHEPSVIRTITRFVAEGAIG